MKKIFARMKLSNVLLIVQILITVLTLCLKVLKISWVDYVGSVWSVVNGLILLAAFVKESAKDVKYYEITGQFIFDKLGGSFSSFMDFLMSEQYKKTNFEEHLFFTEKIAEMAHSGTYEDRRKISRALPYLFDIDQDMTVKTIALMRNDVYRGSTDIRRRTLEAVLTIIQKSTSEKQQRKRAKQLGKYIKYYPYDDAYTVVAIVECLFYLYRFVASDAKQKDAVKASFSRLKQDVEKATVAEIGDLKENLSSELDEEWRVLDALVDIADVRSPNYAKAKAQVDDVLKGNNRFPKLAVVKNLYYTCNAYPSCLACNKCSASTSVYMMTKIYDFLTNALDGDVSLSMPTVRYFDCVCHNVSNSESKQLACQVLQEYFTNDNQLINQTAFDKFGKLLSENRDFAKETLGAMLEQLALRADKQSKELADLIEQLPESKRTFFRVYNGRTKIAANKNVKYKECLFKEKDADFVEIDEKLSVQNETLAFIGKVKRLREEQNL